MKAGVLKETWPGETRVAVVPGIVPPLVKAGVEVLVEAGAGEAAGYPDASFAEKGATVASREAVLAGAPLVLTVRSLAGGHDSAIVARLGRSPRRRRLPRPAAAGRAALSPSSRPGRRSSPSSCCPASRARRAWTRCRRRPPSSATRPCSSRPTRCRR